MRVRIERRGGLVGRRAVGECDMRQLDAAQRAALDRLLRRREAIPSPGADRFAYTILVVNDDGSKQAELEVSEDQMPDVLASIPQLKI